MSGGIVAVVPVRSLRGGKTRLAEALSPEAREALTRRMLGHVLDQTLASVVISRVAVVSPDEEALAAVRALHPEVVALPQPGERSGLNPALDLGRTWAAEVGAAAMIVLFADLPRLTAADVRDLALTAAPLAFAPDRHGTGTNALLLRLGPDTADFAFAFGTDSAARHQAEARRLGVAAVIHRAPGLSFDLDTAADWRSFLNGASDPAGVRREPLTCAAGGGQR